MTTKLLSVKMPCNTDRHITAKSVYSLYKALSWHFKGTYDAIKYNWKGKVSNNEYAKNRHKAFYERCSVKFKLNELVLIFISNLVTNPNAWIGEIANADAIDHYREYQIKLRNVESIYVADLKNLFFFSKKVELEKFSDVFAYNEKHKSSYIFRLLQTNVISYETFMILDSFINIIDMHDQSAHDIVWRNGYSSRLKGYKALLDINVPRAIELFKTTIKEASELHNLSKTVQ